MACSRVVGGAAEDSGHLPEGGSEHRRDLTKGFRHLPEGGTKYRRDSSERSG